MASHHQSGPSEPTRTSPWPIVAGVAGFLLFLGILISGFVGPLWWQRTVMWSIAVPALGCALVQFMVAYSAIREYRSGKVGKDLEALKLSYQGFLVMGLGLGILYRGLGYEDEGDAPWLLTWAMVIAIVGFGASIGLMWLRSWISRVAREAAQREQGPEDKV